MTYLWDNYIQYEFRRRVLHALIPSGFLAPSESFLLVTGQAALLSQSSWSREVSHPTNKDSMHSFSLKVSEWCDLWKAWFKLLGIQRYQQFQNAPRNCGHGIIRCAHRFLNFVFPLFDHYQHSLVVVPSNHRVLIEDMKITKGHGKLMKFGMITNSHTPSISHK